MNKFENPIQFETKKKVGFIEIEFYNLMEICQGGPEVGNLSIDGNIIEGRFGGPVLYQDQNVYVPIYEKTFLKSGFRLVKINVITYEIEYMTKIKDIIFLYKIEMNRIYFFEDLNRTIQSHYEF